MSSNTTVKSAYKMDCFVCNSKIIRGEEITQCIEKTNFNIKTRACKKTDAGRWVHMYCLPKHVKTNFYMETISELMEDYPTMDYEEARDCVDALDYWTLEK